MNRTHVILLALGIGACLLLSMMMKQALSVHRERGLHPVLNRITALHGDQITRLNKLELKGGHGAREALLVFTPAPDIDPDRTAQKLGEVLWRELGTSEGLIKVLVLSSDPLTGKVREKLVERPQFLKGFSATPGK